MIIRELMKTPVIIEKNASLSEAARMMSNKGIGSLLFVSKGKLAGIITEKDLIKNFDKHEKISDAMTRKVVVIEPDATLDDALELMRKNKIKRLPVIEKSELVGIITLTDILANFEELEEDFFF